jgi:phage shock protein PspC (stress-responsive transcriptional regulator)
MVAILRAPLAPVSRAHYDHAMARSTALVRPRRGRILAGVCSGLAPRLGMKPWQVRLLFVASCVLPGPQVLLYIALWIIVPPE